MTFDSADPRTYRSALGAFATGITLVATATRDGFQAATANSFTSVSLEPRLVLVCLSDTSRTLAAIGEVGVFSVNVLAADQELLSRHFASSHRAPGSAGFAGTRFTLDRHGCPRFDGSAASFACRVHEIYPAGDHAIVLGRVTAFAATSTDPLVFHEGTYRELAVDDYDARLAS